MLLLYVPDVPVGVPVGAPVRVPIESDAFTPAWLMLLLIVAEVPLVPVKVPEVPLVPLNVPEAPLEPVRLPEVPLEPLRLPEVPLEPLSVPLVFVPVRLLIVFGVGVVLDVPEVLPLGGGLVWAAAVLASARATAKAMVDDAWIFMIELLLGMAHLPAFRSGGPQMTLCNRSATR